MSREWRNDRRLARGADVIVVEPSAAMAAECRRLLPVVRGEGNALRLGDASCDRSVYAQFGQWTGPAASVPDALRVLRAAGALVI